VVAGTTTVPDVSAAAATATARALTPTVTAAVGSIGGSMRAYLCPLSVLLLFAVGVLVLSIVLPRLQERRRGLETFQQAVPVYADRSGEDQGAQRAGLSEGESTPEAPSPPGVTV
jgi:hypothetical protein